MPAFLVRLIKNRDLVGFFAADDLIDLMDTVDECTDPGACEYAELPLGGIMWSSPAKAIPLIPGLEDGSEPEPMPWGGAELTELWWNFVYGFAEVEWIPFDDEPEPPEAPGPSGRQIAPGKVIPLRRK